MIQEFSLFIMYFTFEVDIWKEFNFRWHSLVTPFNYSQTETFISILPKVRSYLMSLMEVVQSKDI